MAPRQPTGDPLETTHSFALSERTSQTDDQRIRDVTPLPPPEHLIRFFPIADTPIEKLIGQTRTTLRRIMQGQDDRLLVVIGPCSIHDPAAAVAAPGRCAEVPRGWTPGAPELPGSGLGGSARPRARLPLALWLWKPRQRLHH